MKEEILKTKELGDKIGYGNLMMIASALWRKSLLENYGVSSGAFVPRIDTPDIEDRNYDKIVSNVLQN